MTATFAHVTKGLSHVTDPLTHDEFIFSWVVQNFDELHHVRVVEFLQDGYLSVNVVQRTLHLHLPQSTVGDGVSPDGGLTIPGTEFTWWA